MTRSMLLNFSGIDITPVDQAGQLWLTTDQLGRCLGYSETNCRVGINKLYNRHADEFSDADTCVINVMAQGFEVNSSSNPRGGNPNTRIFSATGCTLISMFSGTPRAKEFRAWAKQVLARREPVHTEPAAELAPLDRMAASMERMADNMSVMAHGVDTVLTQMNVTGRYIAALEMNQRGHAKITREIEAQVVLLHKQGNTLTTIARLLRISRTSAWKLVHGIYPETKAMSHEANPDVQGVIDRMVEARRAEITAKHPPRLTGGTK